MQEQKIKTSFIGKIAFEMEKQTLDQLPLPFTFQMVHDLGSMLLYVGRTMEEFAFRFKDTIA